MKTGADKPWMAYRDVVDDLVRPPLHEVTKILTTRLDAADDLLASLRVEHRDGVEHLTGQLAKLEQDGRLRFESLVDSDQSRVELFNRLVAAVDAQSDLSRELRTITDELRREQREAQQQALDLARRLSEVHRLTQRSRSTWIIGSLAGGTLLLVAVDLLTGLY